MNKCFFYGRLTSDPEVKYLANTQKAVVDFTIAVNRDFKNKEGKYDADFFNCVAFDKRGEIIGNSFSKGSRIVVWGAMRQEKWEDKDGNKRTAYRLNVEGFDFVDSVKAKATAAANAVSSAFDGLGEDVDF